MLHIDIETYSSESIDSGVYKYVSAPDFEIILIAYSYDSGPIEIVDLLSGESIPDQLKKDIEDPKVPKAAHNAKFERLCFQAHGLKTSIGSWICTMVMCGYSSFPMSLGGAAKALGLEVEKDTEGKKMIRYFCVPCRPTGVNGGRTRNLPEHNPELWEGFKSYCKTDVVVEKEIYKTLEPTYKRTGAELFQYSLEQEINDRGVRIDIPFIRAAMASSEEVVTRLRNEIRSLTGIENPNSDDQMKKWIKSITGKLPESIDKVHVQKLLDETDNRKLRKVLLLHQRANKSSISKYAAMLNAHVNGRVNGILQLYGASRTGRWAGRIFQPQNIPRIKMKLPELELARNILREHGTDFSFFYGDKTQDTTAQLIRTALIPSKGKQLVVSDFSSIEARVLAWLVDSEWKLEVFRTHGKIYEATASKMFGIPLEEITKESDYRSKGKVAELALGYQGWVGALLQMGGKDVENMDEWEMKDIILKWRAANPEIVDFWQELSEAAFYCIKFGMTREVAGGRITMTREKGYFCVNLPSGRTIRYCKPIAKKEKGYRDTIKYSFTYMGMYKSSKWVRISSYGGKLCENIVQAVARDLLAHSLHEVNRNCPEIDLLFHVHDEIIGESDKDIAGDQLKLMEQLMTKNPKWAAGLPLGAEGYVSQFYRKD